MAHEDASERDRGPTPPHLDLHADLVVAFDSDEVLGEHDV
jgi:hypothetical protein